MLKTKLLKATFGAIYHSGAAQLLSPHWGGAGVIFCLHHVIPNGGQQPGFAPNSNLEITPEFLDSLIRHVRSRGYETVSLSAMPERLHAGSAKPRFAIFTLDDGYRDNLVHAMPVFERLECPFTVYVASRIAEGTCELWWRGLETVIETTHQLDVTLFGQSLQFATATGADKWLAWEQLAPRVQAMPEHGQRDWIKSVAARYQVDLGQICREAAMTWDEVRTMAQSRLATIGAHTLNHYNLLKLAPAEARREIEESGSRIAREIGRPVRHFAYPYGNRDAAGPREFGFAKAAGFETAVVTRLGPVETAHGQHMHALPRIMVSGRYQDLRYIDALMSGVPSRLVNRFKTLNVG